MFSGPRPKVVEIQSETEIDVSCIENYTLQKENDIRQRIKFLTEENRTMDGEYEIQQLKNRRIELLRNLSLYAEQLKPKKSAPINLDSEEE